MSRYRMFRKQKGTWVPQNTLGFHTKIGGTWRLVEHVFEKQSGAWVEVYDATFDSDFEADLANGESLTITSAGTLRITAIGNSGRGGKGGQGGNGGPVAVNTRPLFRRPARVGGNAGGGGGGGRSTGATAVSDVSVVPSDVVTRTDSATHTRIFLNGDLVVSAENGKTGATGAAGSRGAAGRGGKGGEGGKGGVAGLASGSVGNVSRTDGITGVDGKAGNNGGTADWPFLGIAFGTAGTGGQGFPNNGKSGVEIRAGGPIRGGGEGGDGQAITATASCKIEVLP